MLMIVSLEIASVRPVEWCKHNTFYAKKLTGIITKTKVAAHERANSIDDGEDKAHANTMVNSILPEDALSTDFLIVGPDVDSKMSRLVKRMEDPSKAKLARKILTTHSMMQEVSNQLDISHETLNCAKDIFLRCCKLMRIRGKSCDIIVATCIYLACRITHCYRLLSEIVSVVLVDARKVTELSQIIIAELRLSVPITSNEDIVRRYCGLLMFPRDVTQMALRLLQCIQEGQYVQKEASVVNVVVVMLAARLCDVNSPPSVKKMQNLSGKSDASITRV